MAIAQRIDPAIYERMAVHEGYRFTELRDGGLVEKPPVSFGHLWAIDGFARDLNRQLDRNEYIVSTGGSRLRVGDVYLIPDLVVIPTAMARGLFERDPGRLGVYDDPVPLVVEVWSPSTGTYDVETKIPLYQERGDEEIWRVHPIDRTLNAWVRQVDGSYAETVAVGGAVESAALPGVRIDLGMLLA